MISFFEQTVYAGTLMQIKYGNTVKYCDINISPGCISRENHCLTVDKNAKVVLRRLTDKSRSGPLERILGIE